MVCLLRPGAMGPATDRQTRPGQVPQAGRIPSQPAVCSPGFSLSEVRAGEGTRQAKAWTTNGGQCRDAPVAADGIVLSVSPYQAAQSPVRVPATLTFDYYIGLPLLEGHALKPWLHTSFNRNRGNWVSADQIRRWAETGIQTVHCHNDGDYYSDGLFWRDGSYPPYPDMDKYDQVIAGLPSRGHPRGHLFLQQRAAPEHSRIPTTRL